MKVDFKTLKKGHLKEFREELSRKGYTEINTIYRSGYHVVKYITAPLTRQDLASLGFIRKA